MTGQPPVGRRGVRGAEAGGSVTMVARGGRLKVWGWDRAWDVPRASFSLHEAGRTGDPSPWP